MFPSTLSSWLIPIVRALDAAECDSHELLGRAGIDGSRLYDPNARFPLRAVGRFWELAGEATGDPCFGLTVARYWHPSSLHALGYAWLASHSLKDGLERVVRYGRVVNNALKARLEETDQLFRFRVLPPETHDGFHTLAIDCGLATLVTMCCMSADPGFTPLKVSMTRMPPPCPEKFEAFFRCRVEFSAAFNGIEFRKDDLQTPLPTANDELAQASEKIIRDYLARIESADIARRIRTKLLKTLPAGEASEEVVAHALHMSVRTLQRKLKEEGMTFKGLLDDMRRQLAIEYIRDSRLAISEITYLLGFSDPSNFSKAFKRWTGVSPNAFRSERPRLSA